MPIPRRVDPNLRVPLTDAQLAVHTRLLNDLEFFAANCLKIKTKEGALLPFLFNSAQKFIHFKLEEQKRLIGMIRAIIVKGRQQGCSTYVEARFYHACSLQPAKTVSIISHESSSTDALFDKVDLYYRHCPVQMKPGLRTSNKNELVFDQESEYMLTTAGSKNSGRGRTAQYQHQSERGFFENPDEITAGVGQVVADLPGTEIIYESTGNGMNHFYREVMDALAGKNKFMVIFVPWFWQTEYTSPPRLGPNGEAFEPDEHERELVSMYGLSHGQLQWRRDKISELRSERMFKQEYPFTLQEAFQSSGSSFYDPDAIQRARQSTLKGEGPLILGVDPGREGDRTVFVLRRGRHIESVTVYEQMDMMRCAGIISNMIDQKDIDKVFIDYGMGYGTVDRLRERGYANIVEGVDFAGKVFDPQYLNKRAEMAFNFRDWLMDGEVRIPDEDSIASDIMSMPDFEQDSRGKLMFMPKKEIRKKFGRSPDILDAIMLTFAAPVMIQKNMNLIRRPTVGKKASASELRTLNRQRGIDELLGQDNFPSPTRPTTRLRRYQ